MKSGNIDKHRGTILLKPEENERVFQLIGTRCQVIFFYQKIFLSLRIIINIIDTTILILIYWLNISIPLTNSFYRNKLKYKNITKKIENIYMAKYKNAYS